MKIKVGTRGSRLALTQTNHVIDMLTKAHPELEAETVIIKTKGDKIQNMPLDKIGDKGLFVKEIEKALIDGEIDMAVHSMKDMPTDQPEGLVIVKPPQREDARDALILREGLNGLDDVPRGGTIGTGAIRRVSQILKKRPDLKFEPIRGNVETRMKKIETEGLDGVVLAAAGLKRLGLEDRITSYLDYDTVLPSPAQGILAIECREKDEKMLDILKGIENGYASIQVRAERTFLEAVDGGCHIPVGAYCHIDGQNAKIDAMLGKPDGSILHYSSWQGSVTDVEEGAHKLAKELKEAVHG
ncbi:hydroxymethylbilane synthase [Fusibacter sp. JL216-2]|uniref:hydroxymethylbilane synthase n=1 Tax=Fusibacter sp. JL216-2 TaxID=3071453 RepID=UPI003D35748B